jgi:hypothetical protein
MATNASGVDTKNDYYWNYANNENGKGQPVTIDELNDFEYDGVNYLYDMEPPQNNLFWAGNFSSGAALSSGDNTGYTEGFKKREFHNAQFRIQAIDFSGPQFTFQDEPNITHMSYPKSVTLNKDVSITWLEDVYHSVQKYHMDWMTNWYDINTDCFTTGPAGKYRLLDLVLFHYVHSSKDMAEPVAQPIYLVTLRGLVPNGIGQFSYSMAGPGENTYKCTYKANYVCIFYNKAIVGTAKTTSGGSLADAGGKNGDGNGTVAGDIYRSDTEHSEVIWAPITENGLDSPEANRLTHAFISTLNSEGRLL